MHSWGVLDGAPWEYVRFDGYGGERVFDSDYVHRHRDVIRLQGGSRLADGSATPASKSASASGCIIILIAMGAFIGLGCFLGVFFTVHREYGYSMGDAFTLAGFVVAVGALVCSGLLAWHYPRCECWTDRKRGGVGVDSDLRGRALGEGMELRNMGTVEEVWDR